jgi:hypothetical protein
MGRRENRKAGDAAALGRESVEEADVRPRQAPIALRMLS